MKRLRFAAAISAVGLLLGCPQVHEEAPGARPGLDTLRAALVERDELERKYLLASFLREMGPEDVQPVLAEIEKHRTGIEEDEVRLWMLAWTRFDGPGAFATARDWPTPWKSVLMRQAMRAWGYNDGRAAFAEHEKIEDEKLRESLRQEVVAGWVASHDRLGASEYAATVSDERRRFRLALRLAGQAKRDGPDAVIAWAEAVPEDAPNGFKAAAFSRAAGALAQLDPERAASWWEANAGHAYSASALENIAAGWAKLHDPRALVDWLEGLALDEAEEAERLKAYRSAFRGWAGRSSEALEAWIEAAPVGPPRDAAIAEYAHLLANTAPDEALRWAEQIGDDELRLNRMRRFSRKLYAKDPDAVKAWLEEADVPPETRQRILNSLPRVERAGPMKQAEPEG